MVVAENASSRGKANSGNMVTLLLNEKALLSGLLAKLQVCACLLCARARGMQQPTMESA